jgi:hypothetical protein
MQFFHDLFAALQVVAAMWALGCAVISLGFLSTPISDIYDFPWRSTLMGYGALVTAGMMEMQRKLFAEDLERVMPKSSFWLYALSSAQVLVAAALLIYICLAIKDFIQEVHYRRQGVIAEIPGLALAAFAIVSLIHAGKIAAGVV